MPREVASLAVGGRFDKVSPPTGLNNPPPTAGLERVKPLFSRQGVRKRA